MKFPRLVSLFVFLTAVGLRSQNPVPTQPEPGKVIPTSGVLRETWRSGVTYSLGDFEDMAGWRLQPDETSYLPGFAYEETSPGNAITRLTTWFVAPESGDYVFWMSNRGSAKLLISQPDSIDLMGRGGLLYFRSTLGWPQKNQWDLYPSQRIGPWPMEKGRKYLLEVWHAARDGAKRCELAWSVAKDTKLVDWAVVSPVVTGMVSPEGQFKQDPEPEIKPEAEAADAPAPAADLFPPPVRSLRRPGDAFLTDLGGEHMVQRLTIRHALRLNSKERQPDVTYLVHALNGEGKTVAETTYRPESEPMAALFEWELPELLPVAKIVVSIAGEQVVNDSIESQIPVTVEAWGPENGKSSLPPRLVLAGEGLSPSKAGPPDGDGNGLPDVWEAMHPLLNAKEAQPDASTVVLAGQDPDGDGLLNQMESLAGRDPMIPDQLLNRLTADHWINIQAMDVEGLVSNEAFFRKPDLTVVRWMNRASPLPKSSGLRLRGYFTAPVTGEYEFWIAASDSGELWISEDSTKFRKVRIASLSQAQGHGHGVARMSQNQWDEFTAQRSRPVKLEGGKSYFIEGLAQHGAATATGQLGLAWAPLGDSPRSFHRGMNLQTYLPVPEDADDDYLPDEWERLFGLDPVNNGLTSRVKEGERGDFDGDGLSNLLEYQWQTDPSNPDTDGDGKTDGEEFHTLRTDPRFSDEAGVKEVVSIDPAAFSSSTISWHQIGDKGVTAGSYRGSIEWTFEVPEAGYYGYDFTLGLNGQVFASESVPLRLDIDSIPAALTRVNFSRDKPSLWRVAGPWLERGTHQLRMHIDNDIIRRSLVVQSISVFRPDGADFDRDGIPNWYAVALEQGYSVFKIPSVSLVSPVCIEGTAPGNASAIVVNGVKVQPLGDQRWYADVPLGPGATEIWTGFPGRPPLPSVIAWQPTNILTDTTLRVRVGDSLLLAAMDTNGKAVPAQCRSADGRTFDVESGTVETFYEPGTVVLTGTGAGLQGTLTVQVLDATLPQEILVVKGLVRSIPLPVGQLPESAYLEATSGLGAARHSGSLTLLPEASGKLALIARLSAGGPILASSQVNSILVSDAALQGSTIISQSGVPVGYYKLHAPLVVSGLPEGATVEIKIFRAGVMFQDGSVLASFTAADFKDDLLWLDFFYPIGMSGGYCHYVTIRDRAGVVVGRK